MNLTKLEKSVIIILVVGGILAAGIFFFIVPAYKGIEKANKNLEKIQTEQQELETKLAREATIDEEIETAKKEAEKLEVNFYPDLTPYEAIEITLAHLKECNLDTESMTASYLSTSGISLATFTETPVIYDLKTYSKTAHGPDEDALLSGEFLDGGKKYSVTVNSLSDIVIADAESGEAVDRAKYTDTMVQAYKEALCSYASSNEMSQTLGATTVTFTVTGKYEDYLNFINYIFDLERATHMNTVVIPMTKAAEAEEGKTFIDEMGNVVPDSEVSQGDVAYEADTPVEQAVTLIYYSVEPMEALETIDAAGVTVVVNQ